MRGSRRAARGSRAAYGITRAFMFCLDEPDRHPAFRAAERPHARVRRARATAARPVRPPRPERGADRGGDALPRRGARGIKLHPRAQKFLLDDERLAPVFELAADRKRADPDPRRPRPAADRRRARAADRPLRAAADHRPRRHRRPGRARAATSAAARASSSTRRSGARSTCSTSTGSSRPSRCSTPPTTRTGSSRPRSCSRCARRGWPALDDEQLRAMLGGSARADRGGEEPCRCAAAARPERHLSQPLTFARIHQYLSMATPLLWTRQADTIGVLGLALNACDERSNGHREETEQIRELLLAARDLWLTCRRSRTSASARASARRVPAGPPREHPGGDGACLKAARQRARLRVRRAGRPTLAETLRDDLGLTGTKIACGEGHCGACTVQLDGVPVLSCITLVHTVGDREVTTIEGCATTRSSTRSCAPTRSSAASARPARSSRRPRSSARPGADASEEIRHGDGRQPLPLRHLPADRGGDLRRGG